MNQHARMVKTLGGLVVGMTMLSAFLGWIDPSIPLPESVPSFEVMLADARSLVTTDVVVPTDYWRGVTLVTGRADMPRRLTATANRHPAHFVVDGNGRLSRTTYWEQQEEVGGASRQVTIAVARSTDEQPTSRAQWHAVRALVAAVSEATETADGPIPVHLHEDFAGVYRVTTSESLRFDLPGNSG